MGLRPSSQNCNNTVQKYIGTGYDNVKKVADNIEDVKKVAEDILYIKQGAFNFVQEDLPTGVDIPQGARWYKPSENLEYVFYRYPSNDSDGTWVQTYYI